jgi:hypothetical protein
MSTFSDPFPPQTSAVDSNQTLSEIISFCHHSLIDSIQASQISVFDTVMCKIARLLLWHLKQFMTDMVQA